LLGVADEDWAPSAIAAATRIAVAGNDAIINFAAWVNETFLGFDEFMAFLLDPANHVRLPKSCTFLTTSLTVAQNGTWVYSVRVSRGEAILRWGRSHV
jgi:hypothetical protein